MGKTTKGTEHVPETRLLQRIRHELSKSFHVPWRLNVCDRINTVLFILDIIRLKCFEYELDIRSLLNSIVLLKSKGDAREGGTSLFFTDRISPEIEIYWTVKTWPLHEQI